MRINKSKKGISLIVLVITIIVMIILAAAIILSISNSGIMDKANQAKLDSDTANLKEYVNVLEAEWELMTVDERNGKTSVEYVNEKLKEKGYTSALLMEDGTLYTNLKPNAKTVLEAGIQIGDDVTGYILDSSKTSYTTSGNENTAANAGNGSKVEQENKSQTVTRIPYTNWRYIGISENGEILIAPDMITSGTTAMKMKLSGKGGYLNGPKELNDMCEELYSTNKGTARSINVDDIIRILDYTGDKGSYFDADDVLKTTNYPKKISEFGFFTNVKTPDGNDIENYYSDYYYMGKNNKDILKTETDEERKNMLKNFVLTSDVGYWLSSSCMRVEIPVVRVNFLVRLITEEALTGVSTYITTDESRIHSYFVRPVVEINSDVSVSYNNGTLALN